MFNPTSAISGGGHNPQLVMTRMTANGVITTNAPSTEPYEAFYIGIRNRSKRYQYDYQH